MDGSVAYPASVYAKAAVAMAIKLAHGEKLEATVYAPLQVVNRNNIKEFEGFR